MAFQYALLFPGCGIYDAILAVDSSGSISEEDFYASIAFTWNITADLLVGVGQSRLGYLTFSEKPTVHFHLNKFDDKSHMLFAEKLPLYSGGETDIPGVLNIITTNMFQERNGDRPGPENIVLLITDGKLGWNIDPGRAAEEASKLREDGVKVIVLAYGNHIDRAVLESIASPPTERNIIVVNRAEDLPKARSSVIDQICNSKSKSNKTFVWWLSSQ